MQEKAWELIVMYNFSANDSIGNFWQLSKTAYGRELLRCRSCLSSLSCFQKLMSVVIFFDKCFSKRREAKIILLKLEVRLDIFSL